MIAYLLCLLAIVYASVSWCKIRRRRRFGVLPPGPQGLPIIGNVTDLSAIKEPWRTAADWHKQYGQCQITLHVVLCLSHGVST